MGWQLNLKFVQQQIEESRNRQRAGFTSGLAGLAGEKDTPRTTTWDRWTRHKTTVTYPKLGETVRQTYPNYLVFRDARFGNRAERRASAADDRHRKRGPKKRQQERQFATRNPAPRLLIKPTPKLVKRRKPS